jgi:hypothetical protein
MVRVRVRIRVKVRMRVILFLDNSKDHCENDCGQLWAKWPEVPP